MAVNESAERIPALEYDRLRWGTPPARITGMEMATIRSILPGHKFDHVSEDFEETLTFSGHGSTFVVTKCEGGWLLSVARDWPARTVLYRADDLGDLRRQIIKSERTK